MTYPIIPDYLKGFEKDKYTYPLRSKEEIRLEHEMAPPNFPITVRYHDLQDRFYINENTKVNPIQQWARIIVNMDHMYLSPQQRDRLIFLLGSRVRGKSPIFKINCRQYDNYEENYMKAFDILKQLYWEAKRAPGFNLKYFRPKRRYRYIRKYLGKTWQERLDKLEKTLPEHQKFKENYAKIQAEGDTKEKFQNRVLERYKMIIDNTVKEISRDHPEFVQTQESIKEKEDNFEKQEKLRKANNSKKLILSPEKYRTEVKMPGITEKSDKLFNFNPKGKL